MGDAQLACALLATLAVPALAVMSEQPCGLPAPRKLAVEGSRLHDTLDAVVACGKVRALYRDAARYLLRRPVLVPHEPHGPASAYADCP